jgi:hypothetical protein
MWSSHFGAPFDYCLYQYVYYSISAVIFSRNHSACQILYQIFNAFFSFLKPGCLSLKQKDLRKEREMIAYLALSIMAAILISVGWLIIETIRDGNLNLKSFGATWGDHASAAFEEMQRLNKVTREGCNELSARTL